MKANEITAMVLLGVIFSVGIYDVVASLVGGEGASVSCVLVDWFGKFPIVALVAGIVLGHIAWPHRCKDHGETVNVRFLEGDKNGGRG